MPKSGGTNVPESTSFENPSFVHYVDMNQGGGSHSDDENDEIDIDAIHHGHEILENPQYEVFPGAPSFNDHALSAPPRVRTRSVSSNSGGSQKTKKDPVAKLLASFAILLSLIAIAIALANSFSDRNGSATGGGGSLDTAECCSSFGQGNAAASSALAPMESGTGTGSSKNATADLQEDIATLKQRVNGLEVANGALENKYAVSSTALNTSVVFLQSTMDHLMAKNDSVSYDVHIAAMDAMLDKLTVTNAKALANAADTSSLVAMQSKTTGELNASIAALVGDVVQLGTQINSNLMQVQAALNLTDGRVTDSYLQLQRQTAGAAAHEAKVAAINTTVVFLQSTVDHLMAKNDSVSYDMHIAAMEAMLEKYTETEASVL
eukprot:gene25230-20995_t